MKLNILTVGDPGNKHLKALADRYTQRIRRYAPVMRTAVKPVRIKSLSKEQIKQQESDRLYDKCLQHDHVVALDARGEQMSSEDFAQFFNDSARRSVRQITFVIGGPLGLDSAFLKQAHRRLSISAMTLPHELALVVLLEQIYRAHTILKGEPYHK
ncbi:MAG: 23S rRNA (pseudouridine(1915)-N(3))-methyltransferase RlmH [candidate division KSB1 bacterium]|nr:23S rRNA (pseudouridine(1915)-N(3))-methyltransferase RlmH [candidate division KSB1 bacterium]